MLQAEHGLFHGEAALAEDTGGVEQDQGRQQAQDRMAIVGIFPMDLARLRRQQVLQYPEVVFNPASPLPGPDQAGCRDGRDPTEQIVGEQR